VIPRPDSALDNVDPRLRAFWHPVGLTTDPAPATVTLLGEEFDTDGGALVQAHLGLWWFAPEEPIAPLPRVAEHTDPRFVAVHSPPEVWTAGSAQMADNFLDIGHIPWLHRDSFADLEDTSIPRLSPERSDHGFVAGYRHRTRRLHGEGSGRRVMTLWFTAPFSVVMRLEYLDDDAVITAAFFMQPLDADHSRLFAVNWRDDILDGRCTPEQTIAFQQLVAAEDRTMLELLSAKWVPLDLRCEVHTRADATTVEMRRTLARVLGAPR
jgi:hypothetical protein